MKSDWVERNLHYENYFPIDNDENIERMLYHLYRDTQMKDNRGIYHRDPNEYGPLLRYILSQLNPYDLKYLHSLSYSVIDENIKVYFHMENISPNFFFLLIISQSEVSIDVDNYPSRSLKLKYTLDLSNTELGGYQQFNTLISLIIKEIELCQTQKL